VQPAGVADQQALADAELDGLLVLGDHGAQDRGDGGGVGGKHGQAVEAEADACAPGAGGFADRAEVTARGAGVGGSWRGERPEGGGVLPGERGGDAGGVGEQRGPALAGGLLAGEQEQAATSSAPIRPSLVTSTSGPVRLTQARCPAW
jgi:hypothetical protein